MYRNLFDGEVQSSWGAVTAMAVGESAPGSFTSFKMHGVRFASSRVRVCQHANHQGYSRIWPAVKGTLRFAGLAEDGYAHRIDRFYLTKS